MGEFDPIKALREEISGVLDVRATLTSEERRAQEELGRAEVQYNAVVKLRGFVDAEIARKRAVLRELEEKRDADK